MYSNRDGSFTVNPSARASSPPAPPIPGSIATRTMHPHQRHHPRHPRQMHHPHHPRHPHHDHYPCYPHHPKTLVGATSPAELSPAARQQISACLKTGHRATSLGAAVAAFCALDPSAGTVADSPLRIDTLPKVGGWGVYCHDFRRLPITSCCSVLVSLPSKLHIVYSQTTNHHPQAIGTAVFELLQTAGREEMTRSATKAARVLQGMAVYP